MNRYVDKLTETQRRYLEEEIERRSDEMVKEKEKENEILEETEKREKKETEKREKEEKEKQEKEALFKKYPQYINEQARAKFEVKMQKIRSARSQNCCDVPSQSTSSANTTEPPNCSHNSQPPPDKDYLRYLETDLEIFNEELFADADRIAHEYYSSLPSDQTPSTSKRTLNANEDSEKSKKFKKS